MRILGLALILGCSVASTPRRAEQKPNVLIIFADDLGYGDLSCFGHPTLKTPNLDRMAAEGQKWTNFYVAASVCTPSRAGIITGRLPIRSGMCSSKRRVLFPNSKGGLPASETTIAELMHDLGYATGCIGKWHLGHRLPYLPTSNGFDSYFGIPYSNDMDKVKEAPKGRAVFLDPKSAYFNVPLMRDTKVVERPADQTTLTRRYTDEAIRFIRTNKDRPFFLYLAHNLPHVPLFRSKEFEGRSTRGLYGDVVEEIDSGVGRILAALKGAGIDDRTLVVFTSDNGPWLIFNELGGSAGPLRDGKGCTYEGGMREPTIFWWPGKIRPGIVHGLGSTLDILPTAVTLAGGGDKLKGLELDGVDLAPALFEGSESPRDTMFYYRGTSLFAVRKGPYKAHFRTQSAYGRDRSITDHDPPLLYHLGRDPGEHFDVASKHPEVIAEIRRIADAHLKTVKPVENQLEK